MVPLYDADEDAFSFVMPSIIELLPKAHLLLGLFLAFWTIAFLVRIVLTWYPQVNVKQGFWPVVIWPTEACLAITRRIIPPIGGVDVTPVIWVGLISLFRELVVGQQGLLSQILLRTQDIS